MKIYNLKHFSKPEILRKISPELLLKFIRRFSGNETSIDENGTIDYPKLASFFMSPGTDMGAELFDALCLIDEMSNDIHFDLLLEIVQGKDYAPLLVDEISTADLALCVWLYEPWTLEAAHAKIKKYVPKSFIYFRSIEVPERPIRKPLSGQLKKLTRLLNRIFLRKRRGKSAEVNVFEEPGEYWFLIRKGEPLSRDGAIQADGNTECVYYRPERFDQAVLYPEIAELRLAIHKKAPWIVEAYRTLFGWVFYKDKEYFSDVKVFTLSPLYDSSGEPLNCRDTAGIAEVKLAQLRFKTHDGSIITVHGKNALNAFKTDAMPHLPRYEILSAKFRIRFLESRKERMLTISSGNTAEFKYDDDGRIIESWLTARGFKVKPTEQKEK